ncbi:CehA/McbA family metallohydrolase [Hymenobacter sp. BT664]|uniref:CehA/McbA family metallohydrolase n=1 Tax=Hymenobacter montanus TaxID=2771359 RepID=A0A927BE26_9BACT|nr:CehA/McbA family metallohydrolase [Hymenobacter montanus]MBD2768469.1 CehA/McbA family metallohydrolase [Hymenobacter montanus]
MLRLYPHFLCLLVFLSLSVGATQAQNITLLDDFNRPASNSVGNGWTEVESSSSSSCAIVGNQLKLSNGTTAGRDYIVRSVATQYDPMLSNNTGQLTWAFNLRQSRPNPSGFDGSNYGVAFVLAASSDNLLANTTTGYAVVVGNSGTPDPFRLVRFAGGLGRNSNLTNVFTTNTDYGTAYLTLRVSYFPDDDSWTMEAGTSTTAFQDPSTSTFQAIGTGTDATYTGVSLPYVGCLWNHATTGSEAALFDNFYITAPCVPGPEPTAGPLAGMVDQLTSSSARVNWASGNGTARLVVLRAGQAPVSVPVDGTAYAANPAFGSGSSPASGEYVVYNSTGTSATLTNLQANTTYYYTAYEAQGTGCAANYLQSAPLSGSFTTPPCVVAASPTLPASQGTATPSTVGNGLTFTWQNGNGARRLVVVRPAQAVTATPANATSYSAHVRYGSGTALSSDEYVVYDGTGTSVTVLGLTVGLRYHAAVYEFNGSGCTAAYLTSTPATASAVAPQPPTSTSYNFYRGNLHGHSAYSDGNKDASSSGASTPADDYALGRLAQRFDFMGISEHNHSQAGMSLPNYALGLAQANAANQDGTFVTLYGMEYGTISGGGHVIIYGYDRLIGWEPGNYDVYSPKGNYTNLFALVAQQPGAIAYLAHPQASDYNGLLSNPLNSTTAQVLVGAAMRSGPAFSTATDYSNPSTSTFEARYKEALRQGYHVGPTMDHDSHYSVFGRSSHARLVLLAPTLTRAALFDALQQRRFYAADDDNTEVTFSVGTSPMGSVLTRPGAPTFTVSVVDPDAGDAVSSIVLMSGIPGSSALPTQLTASAGSATLTYTDPIPNTSTYYYYAVITQADGDKFWTAPIRYTRNDALPLPVTLTHFQAVLQNEDQAILRWATASELRSEYFVVERSADGTHYQEAGRQPAAGNSSLSRAYELRDPQPLTGLTYYRLRQVDTDGTATYSPVVTLAPTAREAAQANVYPNPVAGRAGRLALRGLSDQQVMVTVRDMVGRLVTTQQVQPATYTADVPLLLPNTATTGIYVVTITTGTQVWTTRWTVEP